MKLHKPLLTAALTLMTMTSCIRIFPGADDNGGNTNVTPESALCFQPITYSSPVTVTGTAVFYKRGLILTEVSSEITAAKLGAPTSSPLPIRYAEIQVIDSAGSVVQCGKTDHQGNFKSLDNLNNPLTIPNTPGNYTIRVLSRANHTLSVPNGKPTFRYVASVKKDIYSNQLYNLSGTVNSSGSGSVTANLIAYARESQSSEILGGAFNIYNSMLVAYEYLAGNTGTSNLTCMNAKMDVYWKAGFNPAQYLYPSEDPNDLSTVSFYVRGDNQLFINGGVQGNVSSVDTDHFDDAVIIHELGHHVEDVCGKMDSPGGTHYGLYRIDPRLAWSEGWGNFFGTHIVRNNTALIHPDVSSQLNGKDWTYYLDTKGYSDGSVTAGTDLIFLNLIKAGNNPEQAGGNRYYDKVDPVQHPGEGHTREVSVSRSLFKGTNYCNGAPAGVVCAKSNNFPHYWKAFENNSAGVGMGKSTRTFRSSSLFFSILNSVAPTIMPSIDPILNDDEAQQRSGHSAYIQNGFLTWVPYGIKLVKSGSTTTACTPNLRLLPREEYSQATGGFSDQRYSSHFFLLDTSLLTGVTEINLEASYISGTQTDIDLILYKEGYRFNQDCTLDEYGDCMAWAKNLSSTDMILKDRSTGSNIGSTFSKKLTSIESLDSNHFYMLAVRAYTAHRTISDTTAYDYHLRTQSGEYLCPLISY